MKLFAWSLIVGGLILTWWALRELLKEGPTYVYPP